MANVSSLAAANPASEGKAPSSALVEKYESGSGKNTINVRIFKEPTEQRVAQAPQEDRQAKGADTDPASKIEA